MSKKSQEKSQAAISCGDRGKCKLGFSYGIFVKQNWLDELATNQQNYGVAVSDVNHDGRPDFIVAGFDGSNFVFVFNESTGTVRNIVEDEPYMPLKDVRGKAIGVAACDIDGDGKEEIYFLNTNQAFAGRASYADKIFKWRNGRYEDLFDDEVNRNNPAKNFAGRSVACVDRYGTGEYAFILATYSSDSGGRFALIEMDKTHPQNNIDHGRIVLCDVGIQAGIARKTGGRGIAVGPILSKNGRSDIFFGNEGSNFYGNPGENFLFKNDGNGTFSDVAGEVGIQDSRNMPRGVALADFNKDGYLDIAYGNWNGPQKLFIQRRSGSNITFLDRATINSNYIAPEHIRSAIAADFDNDGNLELFHNNIYHPGHMQPNKLFSIIPNIDDVIIRSLDVGDALEPEGYGTGAAITDFDGDGQLELLISHGEGNNQSISIFKVLIGSWNNWIRIYPKTRQGAPARGASVTLVTSSGVHHLHVIDGGSGYLCQMEPYAHIGLGKDTPRELIVQWPDGQTYRQIMTDADVNSVHVIGHLDSFEGPGMATLPPQTCPPGKWKAKRCVAACDIDGDGKEEIYFLNTNQAFAGRASYADKIFKWRNGRYEDLFDDEVNRNNPAKNFAGRSVACVDRYGTGEYAFILATYSSDSGGRFALIEMDKTHPQNNIDHGRIVLCDVGIQAGIARKTGGRGIAVGPILSKNGRSDIFFGNEGSNFYGNPGENFLFKNDGNGTFSDVAGEVGIQDSRNMPRGVALADFNKDGYLDIAYGNWNGPQKLFIQRRSGSNITFLDRATINSNYIAPEHIRSAIAADFDNDGNLELFHNNIYHPGHMQPNKLFSIIPNIDDVIIRSLDVGDALEPEGYGTGAAITDFDGDGQLELLISHGEGNNQSISIFKVLIGSWNNWIRIYPKTRQGAPARGASVTLVTSSGVHHLHVIDGGSGYLCQMEPYAHIGLGKDTPRELIVQWPDGQTYRQIMTDADVNSVHVIGHLDSFEGPGMATLPPQTCPPGKWKAKRYNDLPVLCEGDRVTRGPGWRWGNENGGLPGTVLRPTTGSLLSYYPSQGDPYWVIVRWDNGRSLPYRKGSRGEQDLCRCSDCGVDQRCGQCSC